MARPPIVISNGGIADALAEGLKPIADGGPTAMQIILDNVRHLNERGPGDDPPVAKSLSGRNRDNSPRIYWRLEGEDEYPKNAESKAEELGLEAQ